MLIIQRETNSYLSTASSTLADAEPISTPTNLQPLPTGSFSWLLNNSYTATNSCLIDPGQNNAWDCSPGAQLNITVGMGAGNVPLVDLKYPYSPSMPLRFGAQPPQLEGLSKLVLMRDKRESGKGPAYFFTQSFNKTVIVRERDFPCQPDGKKSTGKHESDWTDNELALPSDRPWFCFWNQTILEGFIYVNAPMGGGAIADNSASASSAYAPGATPPPSSSGPAKRGLPLASLSPYPKLIKLEERRPVTRPNVAPYCQQMQILSNGQLGVLENPPVQLNETEPWFQNDLTQFVAAPPASSTARHQPRSEHFARRQAGPNSDCMCVWQG